MARPTRRMTRLLDRLLEDTVTIFTEEPSADVDPSTGLPTSTRVGTRQTRALLRQDLADRQPGEGRVFGVRDMQMKVPDTALVQTGDRVEIVMCRDSTLVGQTGSVVDVIRDSIQAVRRCTIRMESSR